MLWLPTLRKRTLPEIIQSKLHLIHSHPVSLKSHQVLPNFPSKSKRNHGTQDWQLFPALFKEIEGLVGPISVDVCASAENSQCRTFYSQENSMLEAKLAGKHMFMNPPYENPTPFLQHLLSEYSKSPGTTSAAILLPCWKDRGWWELVKDLELVKMWPKGSKMFTRPSGVGSGVREYVGPTKWPVCLFYLAPQSGGGKVGVLADTPKAPPLNSPPDIPTLKVKGKLHKTQCVLTIDSGASADLCSYEWANSHKLPVYPCSTTMRVANGRATKVSWAVKAFLSIQGFAQARTFLVVANLCDEVVLGQPWLKDINPTIDWRARTILFRRDGHEVFVGPIQTKHVGLQVAAQVPTAPGARARKEAPRKAKTAEVQRAGQSGSLQGKALPPPTGTQPGDRERPVLAEGGRPTLDNPKAGLPVRGDKTWIRGRWVGEAAVRVGMKNWRLVLGRTGPIGGPVTRPPPSLGGGAPVSGDRQRGPPQVRGGAQKRGLAAGRESTIVHNCDSVPGTESARTAAREPSKQPPCPKTLPKARLQVVAGKVPGTSGSTMIQVNKVFLAECEAGYPKDPGWNKGISKDPELVQVGGVWRLKGKLVVPNVGELRSLLMQECHKTPYAGHTGAAKMNALLQRVVYWPGMGRDAKVFVAQCDECQRNKSSTQATPGLLVPLPIPEEVGQTVTLDLMTGFCKTPAGNDCIVVFVDKLSKFTWAAAIRKDITAVELADVFLREWVARFGMPSTLVSDRDTRFTSKFWEGFWKIMGTKLAMSTAYHPQTDGQTERANRTILEMLRAVVSPRLDDWDTKLPQVCIAYNNSVNAATGVSPFKVVLGHEARMPIDLAFQTQSDVALVQDKAELWKQTMEGVKTNLLKSQERMKTQGNKKRRDVQFKVGEQVLFDPDKRQLTDPAVKQKLGARYLGPYTILKRVGSNAYKLDLPARLKNLHPVVNVSALKKYRPDPLREGLRPEPEFKGNVPQWVVEDILKGPEMRLNRHSNKYENHWLVAWAGWDKTENTWQTASDLKTAPRKMAEFGKREADRVQADAARKAFKAKEKQAAKAAVQGKRAASPSQHPVQAKRGVQRPREIPPPKPRRVSARLAK